MDANPPCRTLYVRNLPDKLAKAKLRRLLHAAFTPHGHVVWIVAEKTLKLRGQAFITFEQQSSATQALRKTHATEFLGRVLSVTYARAVSDRAASAKLGGDSALSRKA
ncbi:\Probable U2 small nuclear ribonucleoprotein B\\\, partial [Chondrus crispus]